MPFTFSEFFFLFLPPVRGSKYFSASAQEMSYHCIKILHQIEVEFDFQEVSQMCFDRFSSALLLILHPLPDS